MGNHHTTQNPPSTPRLFAGADVGASHTKVVILDGRRTLLGYHIERSGTDFTATADICLQGALQMAGAQKTEITRCISTGYGRKNVAYAMETKTEIGCHGRGCYLSFPEAITIIDIGGQDNKIIKLGPDGHRSSFKMNRKCAAGTGAFLEEMALRLDIPLDGLNDLAVASREMVKLGSFCTVFSATEVLEHIRNGRRVEDLVKGIYFSVIQRITEMDAFTEKVVMTGGVVANNPFIVEMTQDIIGRKVLVPEHPQLTGAIGAALYAMEGHGVSS